ncbi:hypothetical protein CPB83DRAFT_891957 [Crepidotus variabilis]|uniref:Uncharacterized protein n=1 Tax=Crepidotus variabilis TaxID=179855 RepID=A0A9P6EL46_9AGAR|nr:hypothetical protein CPB83DRAFT_891957 [Crepidotus variabilis]
MSSKANVLPTELLELIIDQIPLSSTQGRRSLCTCLFVSKLLFTRARSRLFRHVDLNLNQIERTTAFRGLLEPEGDGEDLTLEGCIKSLKIIWPPFTQSVTLDITDEFDEERFNFKDEDTTIILSVFARTGVLQALSLSFAHVERFPNFQALTSIWGPIHEICHSSSLENLSLELLWDVPYDAFDIWKLKKLSLIDVTTSNESISSVSTNAHLNNLALPQTNSQLQSFAYTFQPHFTSQWLQPSSPFSYLHTLAIKFNNGSLCLGHPNSNFDTLLTLCSSTLESLSIFLDSGTPIFEHYPHSLLNLKALRALKFTVYPIISPLLSIGDDDEPWTVFGQTCDVVESLKTLKKAPDNLKSIEVKLLGRPGLASQPWFKNDDEWKTLGDVLVESQFMLVVKIRVFLVAHMPLKGKDLAVKVPSWKPFLEIWKKKYSTILMELGGNENWR